MTLAILILVPIGLFTLGWLNRDTLIDQLQDWYSENHTGTLTIGKVNANFLSGFPNVSFTIKDIDQHNTDTITDQYSTLHIDEAKVVIGAGKLLRGDFSFNKIVLKNAVITSEVISKRSFEYHQQLRINKQNKAHQPLKLPDWLNPKGASFLVENVSYIAKDSILKKYFNIQIHEIDGSFKGNKLQLTGSTYLDITINNLGFNTEKGSFGNGARLTGRPQFNINLKNETIDIDEFPLHIDEQNFKLNANFSLSASDSYAFELKNLFTDFKAVKSLLTDSLASKIKIYEIVNPFESIISITGKFSYGNSPDIDAQFSTIDNDIYIAEKYHFQKTSFRGYLTTNIYSTDSIASTKKSSKDFKVFFNTIDTEIEGIQTVISNAYYQSTPEYSNFIQADLQLEGSNQSLATVIETDNFDFKGGRFNLNATISGDISNPEQILDKSTGSFTLNDTQVILKKNGLQLPIQSIDISLAPEKSILKHLIINLPTSENLVLRGELKNISGLLSNDPSNPTTSQIIVDSKNLNISEVISLAKSLISKSEKNQNDRQTLHETIDAIYRQFHPQFAMNVDTLQYKEVVINNLKSKIELANSQTILLRNFDFNYFGASTSLQGNVVVHGPESKLKDAIYMNAEATSHGPISVLQELFDIELVRIDSGDYQFRGNVTGNIKKFTELLNNARGDLALTNTKLYYEPADMEVIIDSLSLFVDASDIFLKKFNIEVDDQYPLNLTGNVKKYPTFLLDDLNESGSITLKIEAPFMDGDELLSTIKSFKNEDKVANTRTKKALHRIFEDINKFNPEIELAVDSLLYDGLITENIKALLYFENDSILKLDHLNLKYKETVASINGSINAHSSTEDLNSGNPFDLEFDIDVKGRSENLNNYLKTNNFIFNSGDFEFQGIYKAQAEDLDILNAKTYGNLKLSNTRIDYNAANLQIPVDSLHVEINDDVASLKTFDIKLPGKSSIAFSGTIDNFSDFINPSLEQTLHSSTFSIYSPYLDTADIETFLENSTLNNQTKETNDIDLKTLKQALNDIYGSFYPSITVEIDTLRHEKIDLTKLGLDLYFDLDGDLKMEDTQFNFREGSVEMDIEVGMTHLTDIPVDIKMHAKEINLNELVTRLDYFKNEDLKNADRIEGMLNLTIDAVGILQPNGNLNMNSLNGFLQVDIKDLELYNYRPVMENTVLMKDERFKNLRFRPIVQTFKIEDGVLIIPQTEIQSSAIHLFAEGKIKFNEYVDVWLSLPWKNLKNNDGLTLPEKTTFDNAGSKFYVQLLQDKNAKKERKRKMNAKIRLSNRKLQKQKN